MKGIKTLIKDQKELVVNTIETVKDIVPIDTALKIFNISRTTFQHYISLLKKMWSSQILWWKL
ncbi:hypothetical protein [uncultured Dokdonia sp.]|uniref:hypothetical protein n=1 Tax=uncultured Dokdonia sp. TaxID=575653 RepID=UPI0026061297|nr:hypothetical protein [uncultured Dokdonia sp.]